MIVKTKHGYVVKSESGKVLSSPYKTREQAQRRLRQVHFYSKKGGK